MIELVFPSDTNQQLAEMALHAQNIEVRRGHPGCLEIDRQELIAHLSPVEDILGQYDGRIWAD